MQKSGGDHDGKPWPKLTDFVSIASQVMMDQTVGLSKFYSLLAPVISSLIGFLIYLQEIKTLPIFRLQSFTPRTVIMIINQAMQSQQKQKLQQSSSDSEDEPPQHTPTPSESPPSRFQNKYNNYFSNLQPLSLTSMKQTLKESNPSRLKIKASWNDQISSSLIETDYQSAIIELSYGYFTGMIRIASFQFQYAFKEEFVIGQGQYGTVYGCCYEDEEFVIKVLKVKNCQSSFLSEENVWPIYLEYFIGLIASQLEVGPKILNTLGYDIIFLKNCAFFAMQKCQTLIPVKQHDITQLKTSLLTLHNAYIVHKDIKPQNISWSPTFQKYIFLDFGFSVMEQKKGYEIQCSFAGSYAFCCPEMKKLLILRKSGFIDIYYNDAYGLKSSLHESHLHNLQNIMEAKENNLNDLNTKTPNENISSAQFLERFISLLKIKLDIFNKNFHSAMEKIRKEDHMLSSCLHIMLKCIQQKDLTQDVIDQWTNLRMAVQEKILSQKCQSCEADKLIDSYMKELGSGNLYSYFIPFQLVFQKQTRSLYQLEHNKEWLQKNYYLINPATLGRFASLTPKHKNIDAQYIVNKIYELLKLKTTKLLIKKIRNVLQFFYGKFKEFGNFKCVEEIGEMYAFVNDRINAWRVRIAVLEEIRDYVMYCIKNLKFYCSFQAQADYDVFQSDLQLVFLQNVIQRSEKCESQVGDYIEDMKKISRILKVLRVTNMQKQSPSYKLIEELEQSISQLETKLKPTKYFQQFTEIKTNLDKYLYKLLRTLITQSSTPISPPPPPTPTPIPISTSLRTKLKTLHKKITQQQQQQQQNLFLHKRRCIMFVRAQPRMLNMLRFNRDWEIVREVCEYYLEVCSGRLGYVYGGFWRVVLEKVAISDTAKSIFLGVLLKYVDRTVENPENFNLHHSQIFHLLQAYSQCTLKCQHPEQKPQKITRSLHQLYTLIFAYASKVLELSALSLSSRQKGILCEMLDIAECVRMYESKEEEGFLGMVLKIGGRDGRSGHFQMLNSIIFVTILIQIRKSKPTTPNYMPTLSKTILKSLESPHFPITHSTLPIFLLQITQIYQLNEQYRQNLQLFLRVIKISIHNQYLFCEQASFREFLGSLHLFCAGTPGEVLMELLEEFWGWEGVGLGDLEIGGFGAYLAFWMFSRCHQLIPASKCKKFLYSTARSLPNLRPECHKNTKPQYYTLFYKYHNNEGNERKKLIWQRQKSRDSFLNQNVRWRKLVKIIRLRCLGMGMGMGERVRGRVQEKLGALGEV